MELRYYFHVLHFNVKYNKNKIKQICGSTDFFVVAHISGFLYCVEETEGWLRVSYSLYTVLLMLSWWSATNLTIRRDSSYFCNYPWEKEFILCFSAFKVSSMWALSQLLVRIIKYSLETAALWSVIPNDLHQC